MPTNSQKAIERLRFLEAQFENMRDECHKTRMLLEADVSTPAKKSKLSASAAVSVANVIANRKAFINKKLNSH